MKQLLILKYILRDFLKKILFFKVYFYKPKKKKILVYDRKSESHAKLLFSFKDLNFFDTRYESINLYVACLTLFKNGIKEFLTNYKKNYFNIASPKIIYTSIDNNLGFYKLKKEFPTKSIYISDQNGMRDNNFYISAKHFLKKNKGFNLQSDIIFTFGSNEKNKLKNVIKSKIFASGATKNNFYVNKKKKHLIKNLIFVSNKPIVDFERDLVLFKNTLKFCKKFNYKLYFIDRLKKNYSLYLKSYFNKEDFVHVSPKDSSSTYKFFNEENLLIFNHSSLGYEFMSRGFKCVSFGHNSKYLNHGYKKNYSKEGIFWTNKIQYKNFEKKILTIINYNSKKWKKNILKYSHEIMCYDKFNKNKKMIIKKFLNNSL